MELNEFEKAQIAYDETCFKERINQKVIDDFYKIIKSNIEDINKIYKIEKENNNSFESIEEVLEKTNINNKNKYEIGQRKREDGFLVAKYKESIGVIGVVYNGDPYITISLALNAILSKNAIIFCTNNKMYALTNLLTLYLQQALEQNGYNKELVQVINSIDYSEIYNHNNIIRKIIVIGDKNLQDKVISEAKVDVITSGYGNYDLYIEDILDINLIKKILDIKNANFNVYLHKNIAKEITEKFDIEDYTEIENVEECIRDININSAGYGSSIFTTNGENANKFLKMVKSKNVFVNASPNLENMLDISENDMLYLKQIMYKNK